MLEMGRHIRVAIEGPTFGRAHVASQSSARVSRPKLLYFSLTLVFSACLKSFRGADERMTVHGVFRMIGGAAQAAHVQMGKPFSWATTF